MVPSVQASGHYSVEPDLLADILRQSIMQCGKLPIWAHANIVVHCRIVTTGFFSLCREGHDGLFSLLMSCLGWFLWTYSGSKDDTVLSECSTIRYTKDQGYTAIQHKRKMAT